MLPRQTFALARRTQDGCGEDPTRATVRARWWWVHAEASLMRMKKITLKNRAISGSLAGLIAGVVALVGQGCSSSTNGANGSGDGGDMGIDSGGSVIPDAGPDVPTTI